MALRFGIDLGTTYSAISYYDSLRKDVVTLDNVEPMNGANILRSVVYFEPVFKDDGSFDIHNVAVGETAYRRRMADPSRVIETIKRQMGRGWTHVIDGITLTPEKVSAEIIKSLIAKAAAATGETAEGAVVTVPAYFGDPERSATSEAIRLAGIKELKLLEEPAAAALAYCLEDPGLVADRLLLVYDLGGGTFDISLIRTSSQKSNDGSISLDVETLAKEGLITKGGIDWNRKLAEQVGAKANSQYGADPNGEPGLRAMFEEKVEEAKRLLSSVTSTDIMVTLMGQSISLTRDEFNDWTASLVADTQVLFDIILGIAEDRLLQDFKDAPATLDRYEENLRKRLQAEPDRWKKVFEMAELDHNLSRDQVLASPRLLLEAMPRVGIDVLSCGGSTKMPMIVEMIERVTGRRPITHGNPELLVTRGAAYAAHLLSTTATPIPTPQGPVLLTTGTLSSVLSKGLGIESVVLNSAGEAVGTDNEVLLKAGSKFGEKRTQHFTIVFDNMDDIPVTILEGDSRVKSECRELKTFHIMVPPGRKKGNLLEVTLWVDESGIIRGAASDKDSGRSIEIVIEHKKQ